MLYVMVADWKSGLSREQQHGALARRAQWQHPAGAHVVGEYWLGTHAPAVISIFEADDYAPIMELSLTWQDVFDLHVFPAITLEEGLRLGPEVLQRLGGKPAPGEASGYYAA